MQNKKQIAALTTNAAGVLDNAPKPVDHAWSRWAAQVRDVVADNMDGSDGFKLRRNWDYDESSGQFYFSLSRRLTIETAPGKSMVSSLESNFVLDPKKDLTAEIERLQSEVAAWDAALVTIRRAQLAAVLKEQGQEAYDAALRRTI